MTNSPLKGSSQKLQARDNSTVSVDLQNGMSPPMQSILFNIAGNRSKASSRVRGFWIGEELENRGHRVRYLEVRKKIHFLSLVLEIPKHDVVVFQKTLTRYHPLLARWARFCGVRCFLDIDDHPSRALNARTMRNTGKIMRACDGVMAGSSALLDMAVKMDAKAHLVPTGIRPSNYQLIPIREDDSPICLGWIGNGAHYVDDLLDQLTEPLRHLAERHPLKFRLVGACGERLLYEKFGAIKGLTIEFIDQIDWTSAKAVSEAIAPIDVGLYPLSSGSFNDFKCGFKALEYMASGLPFVASDVAANINIVSHNVDGLLVRTSEDWIEALERLITDFALRSRLGTAGRLKIETTYDTAVIARKLEGLFATNHYPDGD